MNKEEGIAPHVRAGCDGGEWMKHLAAVSDKQAEHSSSRHIQHPLFDPRYPYWASTEGDVRACARV